MSLITPDFGLLFWMTLIFVILFFILAKVGFPVITGMVSQRQDRINDSIRLAKEAEERVRELSSEQTRMIEEARKEQAVILRDAASARDAMVSRAQEQAREEAAKIIEQARIQIAAEKEAALRDIRREVAELSVSIAEQVVRKDLSDNEAQMALIDRLMDEMSSTKMN